MWIATDHPSAATACIGQRIAAAACIIRDHSNAAASTAKARAANRRRFGLIAAATGRAAAEAFNRSAGAVASLGAVSAAYMVAAFARSVARTHRALRSEARSVARSARGGWSRIRSRSRPSSHKFELMGDKKKIKSGERYLYLVPRE